MKFFLALFSFIASAIACAEVSVSDSRAVEILQFCSILEEGGISFQGDANFSHEEMKAFYQWFRKVDDPLVLINKHVSSDMLRARAIVAASEALSDEQFYCVSLQVLRRYAGGSASLMELERVLLPSPDKRGLLAVHFRDEQLRNALDGCLKRGVADSGLEDMVRNIITGEGAKNAIRNVAAGAPARFGGLAKQALKNENIGPFDGANTVRSEMASGRYLVVWAFVAAFVLMLVFCVYLKIK